MSYVLAAALYFVIWWMVLFAVLPFGVKSQFETGEVVPGSEGAAPQRPMLWWKALATTLIALAIWGVVCLFVTGKVISLDAIHIGPLH